MDDRSLRDVDRWREKIEVRLDNRQVFFLFFGSALVACLLFVLGVIVGKRLESRGRAVVPEVDDPLALLDRVASTPGDPNAGLTFPQELLAPPSPPTKGGKKSASIANLTAAANPAKKDVPPPASQASSGELPATPGVAKVDRRDGGVGPVSKPKVEPGPSPKAPDTVRAPGAPIPTVMPNSDPKSRGHYTLQLSSFQVKSEAEAFARRIESENPYLVMSDIPGKGVWYRVRVGDYPTEKEANTAKNRFEKKHNMIAYIARR